ncbi:hypothetical protein CEXT_414151, partial [Caerostris extrusa]
PDDDDLKELKKHHGDDHHSWG